MTTTGVAPGGRRRVTRQAAAAVKSMRDASDSESEASDDVVLNSDGHEPKEPKQPAKRKSPAKAAKEVDKQGATDTAKPRKRQKADISVPLNDLTLMDIVGKHPNSVTHAAKEWVARYVENKPAATAELMTLVAQASSSHEILTEEDVDHQGADDLAARLLEKALEEGGTDPFRDRKLPANRTPGGLHTAFTRFLDALVDELYQADQLFDEYAMDKLCNFIISLSVSMARPFRACSTLAICQLITSWINVLEQLNTALATALKQKEAQEAKKATKAQLASLQRQVDQHHRRINSLKDMVSVHFTSICAQRFRDVCEGIRATVVRGIGSWVLLMPDMFLADSYLKYLAWAQSDKDASVRLAAVESLLNLYRAGDPSQRTRLHEFTLRFASRFKELPCDVDEKVAVRGVQLLAHLVELGELQCKDVQSVYRLLADDVPELRSAAAQLVVRLMAAETADAAEDSGQEEAGGRGRRSTKAGVAARKRHSTAPQAPASPSEDEASRAKELQLARLLAILSWLQTDGARDPSGTPGDIEASPQERLLPLGQEEVSHLVDALHGKLDVLRDWKALAGALADDQQHEGRSPTDSAHLAMLLATALHRVAAGAEQPAGRKGSRSKAAGPDAEELHRATTTLMPLMPSLIRKYQTEMHVVTALVSMVPELQLELYSLKQEEAAFEDLLTLVADTLTRQSAEVAISAAASALTRCSRQASGTLQARASSVLHSTVSRLSIALVSAAKAVQALSSEELEQSVMALSQGSLGQHATLGASPSQTSSRRRAGPPLGGVADELYALQLALLRIFQLATHGARAVALQSSVYETLQYLLEDAASGRFMGAGPTRLAAHAAFTILQWGVVKVADDSRLGHSAGDAVRQFVTRRTAFAAALVSLCDVPGADDAARDDLYFLMADFLLLFGDGAGKYKGTALEEHAFTPSDGYMQRLWAQCEAILLRADTSRAVPGTGDGDESDAEDAGQEGNSQQEGHGDGSGRAERRAARAAAVAAKVHVLVAAGRLLATDTLSREHFKALGAKVISHFAAHGPEVAAILRQIALGVRRRHPADLPLIFIGAMQLLYSEVLAEQQRDQSPAANADTEGEETTAPKLLLRQQAFAQLCQGIAGIYAGHNLSRPELLYIIRAGCKYALQEPPSRLGYLAWGLTFFTTKVPADDASLLADELEAAASNIPHEEGSAAWRPYGLFLRALKEKSSKGRVTKSVLKASTPGAKPAAKRRGRKISFAGHAAVSDEGGVVSDDEGVALAHATTPLAPSSAAKRHSPGTAALRRGVAGVVSAVRRGRSSDAAAQAAEMHESADMEEAEAILASTQDAQAMDEEEDAPAPVGAKQQLAAARPARSFAASETATAQGGSLLASGSAGLPPTLPTEEDLPQSAFKPQPLHGSGGGESPADRGPQVSDGLMLMVTEDLDDSPDASHRRADGLNKLPTEEEDLPQPKNKRAAHGQAGSRGSTKAAAARGAAALVSALHSHSSHGLVLAQAVAQTSLAASEEVEPEHASAESPGSLAASQDGGGGTVLPGSSQVDLRAPSEHPDGEESADEHEAVQRLPAASKRGRAKKTAPEVARGDDTQSQATSHIEPPPKPKRRRII